MTQSDQTDADDFDLLNYLPYRLAVAAQKTSEELARRYRDRFGISIPEWRVIVHVSQVKDVSVRDIENRAAMEKSKVSRAATRLEEAGFITKTVNEGDRRLVRLSLTQKGEALMADLIPLAQAYQQEIITQLGADFKALDIGLEALLKQKDAE